MRLPSPEKIVNGIGVMLKSKASTVVVSSDKVAKPLAVRYAWAMNPSRRNLLYNKEGLPASPFRTDTWSLFEAWVTRLLMVNKPAKPDRLPGC